MNKHVFDIALPPFRREFDAAEDAG